MIPAAAPERSGPGPCSPPDPELTEAGSASRHLADEAFGHRFASPSLLHEALTHRTASDPRGGGVASNERLEFLGDRVLGLVIAEWLVERHRGDNEGQLGLRNAALISRETAARIAERTGLAERINVPMGERNTGLRNRHNVLADATEAVLGAIFLDGGLDAARSAVRRLWAPEMDAAIVPPKDPKTTLQEWALGRGHPLPSYLAIGRSGPPHAPRFKVAVEVVGRRTEGEGLTKRAAERSAASRLLELLAGKQ